MKSVANVFRILDLFVKKERGLMFHELEEEVDLPKSTLHTLLDSMESAGALHRDRVTGQYHLTHRFVAYGRVAQAISIEELALPFMEELSKETGESVSLAVMRGNEQVIVSVIEAPDILRACPAIGSQSHMHFTSVGKAMLSCLPDEEVRAIVESTGLVRATENTITDYETFYAELETVRRNGFGIDDAEHNPGIRCVGSAVQDGAGRPVAGISIVAPAMRITTDDAVSMGPRVRKASDELAKKLGRNDAFSTVHSSQGWYSE